MPPDRTFNYDVLNQVIRDHPEWSNIQYADAMTQYERAVRGDPRYPRIKPNAIARAISVYRKTWADEGRPVKERQYGRLVPWSGIPQAYLMDSRLRHLKTLEKLKLGQPVTPVQERQARAFERGLRASRQVVDIRDTGKPFVRKARPQELDEHGDLIKLTADPRPGWEGDREETDPEDYVSERWPEASRASLRG